MRTGTSLALLALLALPGCGTPPLVGEAHFSGLTEQEHAFILRFPNVEGEYGELELDVQVTAPGAAWAVLIDDETRSGGARRAADGAIELMLARTYVADGECGPSVCERRYVVALSEAPPEPWDLTIEAIVFGDVPSDGRVEIIASP